MRIASSRSITVSKLSLWVSDEGRASLPAGIEPRS